MKKKNKGFRLLGLLILLIILIACYFAVIYSNQKREQKEAEEEEETITIGSAEKDSIAAFSFENDGTTYAFTKTDDTWVYDDDNEFPVDQDAVDTLLDEVVTVSASRLLEENTDNYSDYGLTSPSNVITVSDTDGNTTTYHIGDENSVTTEYYVYVDDNDSVYMIPTALPDAFDIELYDLVSMGSFPTISSDEIYHMSGTIGDMNVDFTRNTTTDDEDNATNTWVATVNDGTSFDVDSTNMETLLEAIGSLTYDSEVEYNCSSDELGDYGLLSSGITLTIDYYETHEQEADSSEDSSETTTYTTEESVTVSVGNQTEDGEGYYVKTEDSNAVYIVTGTISDQITDLISENSETE